MSDTSPEIARTYRAMLLRRSGAERVNIGASMFATARALAVASLRARAPSLSGAALRRELFLRFYGADFGPDARERIVMRLGAGAPSPGRSPRRVPVNWDDLEMALTANGDEWTCYLDVRTGEAHMVAVDLLGLDEDELSEEAIDAGLDAGHLIAIEPLGASIEYGWMAEFAASVIDAGLRDRLEVALDGRGAFRRFKNVLLGAPVARERWFAFRDARLREAAREWLADHELEATTRPSGPDRDPLPPRPGG